MRYTFQHSVRCVLAYLITTAVLGVGPVFSQTANQTGDLFDELLSRVVHYRLEGRFETALKVIDSGIEILALEEGEEESIQRLHLEKARTLVRQSFHQNSLNAGAEKIFHGVIEYSSKNQDTKLLAEATYGLGHYQFKKGRQSWPIALDTLAKALSLAKRTNHQYVISHSLFSIGVIHQRSGKSKLADSYFDESLKSARLVKSAFLEGENERHIGYQFYLKRDYRTALKHFEASLNKRRSIGYSDGAIFALITLGQTYEKVRDFDRARSHLAEALELADRIESNIARGRVFATLARIDIETGKAESAKVNLTKAAEVANKIGYDSVLATVEELSDKLEKMK